MLSVDGSTVAQTRTNSESSKKAITTSSWSVDRQEMSDISLPSASKIYQKSVKPRQKSASSVKKRRKKVHTGTNQPACILDDSVVSLVNCDQESFGEPNDFINNRKDLSDNRIQSWKRESSCPEMSHNSVETCEISSRITNKKPEQTNHIDCQRKEIHIRKLSMDLGCIQNHVLPMQLNENEQHNEFESSIEENFAVGYPSVMNEKFQEKMEVVLTPEILHPDSNQQDLSYNETIKFDQTINKVDSETTLKEVEASINHYSSKELSDKEAQVNEIADENFIHPEDYESNVSSQCSERQHSINKNITENSNIDTGAAMDNIIYKENNDLYTPEVEKAIQTINLDICHTKSSNNINDVPCTMCKENTDSATVNDSESQLNIIPANPDVNGNCFIDNNINNSEEIDECWSNAESCDSNNPLAEVSVARTNSGSIKGQIEFCTRTQSPEQSELSYTESMLCEAKDCHRKILYPEKTFSNSAEKSEDFILLPEKMKDCNMKNSSNISQSSSDLLQEHSQSSVSIRCFSLPDDLHLSKKFMDKHSQSVVSTVMDKATLTVGLECDNNSNESLLEKNLSHEESLKKILEYPLTKNSKSSSENKDSLGNVLPPLSMVKARSRSYVFGCKGLTGSLLGSDELNRFFPDNQVTIFVGTWNMNGHDPPRSIDDFLLPLAINTLPDIYAIGIQESMQSRLEWEVLLQTTLGPSHVLFTSTSLGVLHLCIFLRRDLIWFCSEPEESNVATRPGTMVKTKGAVALCFMCFGSSFLFVNSHLTAHEQKLKERLTDYEKIISSLDLPKSIPLKNHFRDKDVTSRFDCVFWCGDLNFRVMHDRPSVLSFVEEKARSSRPSCSFLVKHDQLHKAMEEGQAFHGFKESVIHFIPSYKFDVGTSTFNSSKLRVPSYTDRILYRCKENSSVACLYYNAVPDISTSDHKPVYAVFKVKLRPGRDNVPLAAGMFKRDVYLEAIKRRSKFLEVHQNQGQSAICSLM